MTEERQLLEATIQGDTAAFEMLVRKYQNLVCAITFSGTGRVEIGEELAQEAFLNAWRNLVNLKEPDKFRSWLCSIARNLVRNYHREKKPEFSLPDDHTDLVDPDNNPSEKAVSREEVMILEQALKRISVDYREPLVLFYRQGRSIRQVAEGLGLNEATVKTRLHRGRQMLKEQTAAMVEQTLEKTAPNTKFTKAVMVSVGAGLAAGVAGTATATSAMAAGTGASASTSIVSTMTSLVATVSGKIAVAAAAVIITTGIAVYSYNNVSSRDTSGQQAKPVSQAMQQQQENLGGNEELNPVQPGEILSGQSPSELMESDLVMAESEIALLPNRHPDWPRLDEPVNSIYIKYNDGSQMQRWIRFPRMHRSEDMKTIYIDNSKERIEVSKIDGTLQFSYALEKPLDRQGNVCDLNRYLGYVYMFGRSPNRSSDFDIKYESAKYTTKLITQEDYGLQVYEIYRTKDKDSGLQGLAYVDATTRLPEKIQVFESDPNNPENRRLNFERHYNFSPIPDSIFEYTANGDQEVLPYNERPSISGMIVDTMNNPVAGADVYVHYNFIRDKKYLTGQTDINGRFEINLPPSMENWPTKRSIFLPVVCWATIPDQPDFVAWTMLTESEQDLKVLSEMPSFGGNVIQAEQGLETVTKVENGVTTTYKRPKSILVNPVISDVLLVMEPAGTIAGYVTDKEGNTIADTQLTATFNVFWKDDDPFHFFSSRYNWEFSAVSDSEGYYEIRNLPAFWKKAKYIINCNAEGYVSEQKEVNLKESLDLITYDIALNPELVTVRGILKDDYGVPLVGKSVSLSAWRSAINGCSGQTDPNGFFEIQGCPDIPGLSAIAWLSQAPPEGYPLTDKEKLESYMYYPDISQEISYLAGQPEYFVEMTAIRPETTVEIMVTNSAGNPLPDFKVKVDGFLANNERWPEKPIPSFWSQVKLEKRTDSDGRILFDNVPDLSEMKLVVSPGLNFTREMHALSGKMKEVQRLKKIDEAYKEKYQAMEIPVELVEGQTEYSYEVVVLAKEEFKEQGVQ